MNYLSSNRAWLWMEDDWDILFLKYILKNITTHREHCSCWPQVHRVEFFKFLKPGCKWAKKRKCSRMCGHTIDSKVLIIDSCGSTYETLALLMFSLGSFVGFCLWTIKPLQLNLMKHNISSFVPFSWSTLCNLYWFSSQLDVPTNLSCGWL